MAENGGFHVMAAKRRKWAVYDVFNDVAFLALRRYIDGGMTWHYMAYKRLLWAMTCQFAAFWHNDVKDGIKWLSWQNVIICPPP